MSFGLTNAPTTFMDLMNTVFRAYLDKFMVVFIDDILVYFRSLEEHAQHLRIVLQTLKEHLLYAKFLKCESWLSKVSFLGHIVFGQGVQVDPSMVEVRENWPRSTSVTKDQDEYLIKIFGDMSEDKARDFVYGTDGLMRCRSRAYVPNMDNLRNEILEEEHVAAYAIRVYVPMGSIC
ncbi:Reverse transcriptase domain - like 10 [Theobroma cacao]|nr:Reverse transcriptase domain - like 10 [Theobroma cacao]